MKRLQQRDPAGATAARWRGFTLLELMATLAVAAILVVVGVPGFVGFLQNTRATSHTNDLVTALNLARSEATQRGTVIRVCSSTDGATCGGSTNWSTGWVVLTPDGDVIRAWPERTGGANVLTGTVTNVEFQPRGSVAAAGTVFEVRVPDCTGNQGRDVRVNVPGRVSVSRVDCG